MRLIEAILQHCSDGIVVTDLGTKVQYVNPAFTRISGYTPKEMVGRTPAKLKSGRYAREFYREMWEAVKTQGGWHGKIWNRRKNGALYVAWLTITTITNADKQPCNYLGVFREQPFEDDSAEPFNGATHDPLTGLPNRILLESKMTTAIALARRNSSRVAVLYLDLKDFRPVNELLGHPMGDRLLQEVADRINARVREFDTVCRLEADRFIVVITDVKQLEDISFVARNILRWLEMPFSLDSHTVAVSPSIGIALYPDDHSDILGLLVSAQQAMQRARTAGKGRMCFYNPEQPE
jgi:diguanylate cyclase (GGDEF)-like protein/PAS domain S-box-containing protein